MSRSEPPSLVPTLSPFRAYWTQHLPPDVTDLRAPSGDLIYTPPDWLPLTDEQLDYLGEHLPSNHRRDPPEEKPNLES